MKAGLVSGINIEMKQKEQKGKWSFDLAGAVNGE